MRRHIDTIAMLALFAFLALFVHAHTRLGAVKAKPAPMPAPEVVRHAPTATVQHPATKFELLFGEPELALP
jgi:hypothetical protein